MNSKHRRERDHVSKTRKIDVPEETPEWLEQVRVRVEREAPLMQALMRRAITAVMQFNALSEDSVVDATAAPTDLAALVRALSSDELLADLKQAEPLAPAFIRGIEEKRQLIDEHGG